MARFTLRVALAGYDDAPVVGQLVTALPTIESYPDAAGGTIHVGIVEGRTDQLGEVDLELVTLPGLGYRIEGAGDPRVIPGDFEADVVVELADLVSPAPSPISAVDAAALRAELIAIIDDALAGGGPGGTAYDDTEVRALITAEQTARAAAVTAEQTARADADTSLTSNLTTGLAGKAPTGHLHTAAQVTDFVEAAQDAVAAMLGAGSNITLTYNDAANTLTIGAVGDGTGLDAEAVRDAIGVAMVGVGNIAVAVNDAADTITITTTATANATDAALRDRSTHTGTQAIDTIAGLPLALAGKVDTTDARLTDARPPTAHSHDDRYYTEAESDGRYLPLRNGVVNITDPTTQAFADVNIIDDGSDTANWPERFRFLFNGKLTSRFNEYGELRGSSAKSNTVAARWFTKETDAEADHSTTVPIIEVVLSRQTRTNRWALFGNGDTVQAGKATAASMSVAVPNGPTLTVGYLVLATGAAVPANTPAGTVIYRT